MHSQSIIFNYYFAAGRSHLKTGDVFHDKTVYPRLGVCTFLEKEQWFRSQQYSTAQKLRTFDNGFLIEFKNSRLKKTRIATVPN